MNRTKRLGKDIVLFAIASFIPKILSFILVPLYTSCIKTEEYGTFDLLNTIVSLILPVLVLDISDSILVFTVEDKSGSKGQYLKFGNKILFISATITLIIGLLVVGISNQKNIGWQFCYIWIQFILLAFYNNLLAFLRGTDNVNWIVLVSVFNSMITILLNVFLILILNMGMFGLMISNTIGWLCSDILICIKIKPNTLVCKENISSDKKHEMLAYCCPLILAGLSWWVISSEDRIFVSILLGTSVNGIYAVATKIPTILNACHSVIYQAMQLSVFSEIDSKDSDKYLQRLYNIYSSFMLVISSFIIAGDKILSKILYKKDYFVAWKYVPGLVIAIALFSVAGYVTTIAAANRDSKTVTKATICGAIINTILNAALIKILGLMGAVIATMVSYLFVWFIITHDTNVAMNLSLNITRVVISVVYLCVQWGILIYSNGNILIQLILLIGFLAIHWKIIWFIISKILKLVVQKVET